MNSIHNRQGSQDFTAVSLCIRHNLQCLSRLEEQIDHRAKYVTWVACCAMNVMILAQLFINYLNMNG